MSQQQVTKLAGFFAAKMKSYDEMNVVTQIATQEELVTAVEDHIDANLGGLEMLFQRNEEANSPDKWAELFAGTIENRYELVDLEKKDIVAAVKAVKDKHRVQLLSNLAANLVYATTDTEPYSVDNLKELMTEGGAYLEDEDDDVLEKIFNKTVGQDDTGPKIGLDPNEPADKELLENYYIATGGLSEWGNLYTVCTQGGKHGGTYTVGEDEYQMFHDSHGPKEANSGLSVTAWKILVNDRLQVVGVGHHVGPASYDAIFPLSTNANVRKNIGPSPDVVHKQ